MKIISKFQDYYDYCVSRRGIDPHVVYDRRNGTTRAPIFSRHYLHSYSGRIDHVRFYIAGMVYDILLDNHAGRILHGQEAFEFISQDKDSKIQAVVSEMVVYKWYSIGGNTLLIQPVTFERFKEIYNNPALIKLKSIKSNDDFIPHDTDPNDYFDAPVVFTESPRSNYNFKTDAQLKAWGFASIVPAEQMFDLIYNWLLQRKEKTIQKNNQTDKEKIVSHGFDLKTSFRK